MKTLVILGAGQFGRAASNLLNYSNLSLAAFGDNNPNLQGTSIRHPVLGDIPVISVEEAVELRPDIALISVTDELRSSKLCLQAKEAGFSGELLFLGDFYRNFDIRSATLLRLAERIHGSQIPGAIAELGVYKGELAWKLNALFPRRDLYLFDTFEGFDSWDIAAEQARKTSFAKAGDFSDTTVEAVLNRLPYRNRAIVRKGRFPATSCGLEEERYALVSLDADLYAPILAGLEYFYPRLNSGGVILLHDYNNTQFRGAKQAVEAYEKLHGGLLLVPLSDLHGSAIILKP